MCHQFVKHFVIQFRDSSEYIWALKDPFSDRFRDFLGQEKQLVRIGVQERRGPVSLSDRRSETRRN